MKQRSPQEKKALSYERDRRNAYGNNDKAARKGVPWRKRWRARGERRVASEQLSTAVGGLTVDDAEDIDVVTFGEWTGWRKEPDVPLRDWAEMQRLYRSHRDAGFPPGRGEGEVHPRTW